MSNFSYEFCINHLEQSKEEALNFSDFNILEESKILKNEMYISIIDEWYGFSAICKHNNEIYLIFSFEDFSKAVKYKDLDKYFIEKYNIKYEHNLNIE